MKILSEEASERCALGLRRVSGFSTDHQRISKHPVQINFRCKEERLFAKSSNGPWLAVSLQLPQVGSRTSSSSSFVKDERRSCWEQNFNLATRAVLKLVLRGEQFQSTTCEEIPTPPLAFRPFPRTGSTDSYYQSTVLSCSLTTAMKTCFSPRTPPRTENML